VNIDAAALAEVSVCMLIEVLVLVALDLSVWWLTAESLKFQI